MSDPQFSSSLFTEKSSPSDNLRVSRKPKIIACSVFFGLCLCVTVAGYLLKSGVANFNSQNQAVSQVLDSFMRGMVKREIDKSYDLFSVRAKRQMTKKKLSELSSDTNYCLFDGYQSISINSVNFGRYVNTNQDSPQGNVARVQGTIYYQDGYSGNLNAVLEQDNNQWRLYSINITVTPQKMEEYLKKPNKPTVPPIPTAGEG